MCWRGGPPACGSLCTEARVAGNLAGSYRVPHRRQCHPPPTHSALLNLRAARKLTKSLNAWTCVLNVGVTVQRLTWLAVRSPASWTRISRTAAMTSVSKENVLAFLCPVLKEAQNSVFPFPQSGETWHSYLNARRTALLGFRCCSFVNKRSDGGSHIKT